MLSLMAAAHFLRNICHSMHLAALNAIILLISPAPRMSLATVAYLNYQFSPLDNISFRPEFYDDMAGQRTGVKTRYANLGIGWQHWLSPQIEFRPEVDFDYSLNKDAFNGNSNAGVAPGHEITQC